ncbi:hypothetical protein [Lactococcus taiwanensis]|uniref:hypothetical protein n=1 Tax=Lactococcus taiwanensis TaxID=1151742 RepID=UPI0035146CF6
MIELTKTEYKLLKKIEDNDSTLKEISALLKLPFNHALDLAGNLNNEELLFIDMALNISLTPAGRAAIYRYKANKRNDFRQTFWFPLVFMIIGAILGVLGTIVTSIIIG